MRICIVTALFLLVGCAGLREPKPIAEQQDLGFAQITHGTAGPNIKNVRALRYNDHMALLEECFLLDGRIALRTVVQSARAQCQSALTNALSEFEAKNIWQLSGLRSEPPRWSSGVDSDGTLTFKGSLRVTFNAL